MDERQREAGLIDGWMGTLTDGQLAGELHDWAGDDGCFRFFLCVFVCESGTESVFFYVVESHKYSGCTFGQSKLTKNYI